ncbi:helix-turn-helix domain-containing protein [Burkholderia ubonensis]|uniref:helix-turn-helix domain-containing protein n=1 Tax=Burkholderia ubonensis TaxID=101571 RepID=UPI0022B75B3D|nr:helix-turn-helix domain-containing protein [Burkholderia ubonensis]
MKKYRHLSAEDRAAIMLEHQRGASLREIARRLGRRASTVSRELSRNRNTARPCDDTRAPRSEADA